MYKNCAPIHCRHIWVDMNALQFICLCCKKSLNVCGFSKSFHTTENILINPKKGKKNIRTEELLSQFSEMEFPIGN